MSGVLDRAPFVIIQLMPLVQCPPQFCQFKDASGRGTTFHIAPSHLKRMKRPPTCSQECRAASMKGEHHWLWKGGRYIDSEGYVRVWTANGHQLEHRVVAEQMLKRPLRDDEVVHHRDEDRQNNAPENLKVVSDRGEHTMDHHVVRGRGGQFRRVPGSTPTKGAVVRQHKAAFNRLKKQAPRPRA
jgi:hypothetical protein